MARIALRTAVLIAALSLLFVLVWVIQLQFGWIAPPADAPLTAELYDPDYAEAGVGAAQSLAEMRSRTGVPGASAAVSIDGRLVWAAGVGFADIETGARRHLLDGAPIRQCGGRSEPR